MGSISIPSSVLKDQEHFQNVMETINKAINKDKVKETPTEEFIETTEFEHLIEENQPTHNNSMLDSNEGIQSNMISSNDQNEFVITLRYDEWKKDTLEEDKWNSEINEILEEAFNSKKDTAVDSQSVEEITEKDTTETNIDSFNWGSKAD